LNLEALIIIIFIGKSLILIDQVQIP